MDSTFSKEERDRLLEHVNSGYVTISGEGLKRALAALEQAEARAEKAEARVKARNKHIHTLLCEALENERNLDGMKSRWQTSEDDNARLTKMVDWLAEACAEHCHDKCGDDARCSFVECEPVHCNHATTGQWKEAARWAVAKKK